jgi:hypothetical protein
MNPNTQTSKTGETTKYKILYDKDAELIIESKNNLKSTNLNALEIGACYDDTYTNPKEEVHQDLDDFEDSVEIPFSKDNQKTIRTLLSEEEFNLIKSLRMIKDHSIKERVTKTICLFSNNTQDELVLNIHVSRKFNSGTNRKDKPQKTSKRNKSKNNGTNKIACTQPTQEELDQIRLKVLKQIEEGKRSHINFCSYQHDSDYKPCTNCKTVKENLVIRYHENKKIVDNCYKIFNYVYDKIDAIDLEKRILIMESCTELKMHNYYNVLKFDCLSQGLETYGQSDDDDDGID